MSKGAQYWIQHDNKRRYRGRDLQYNCSIASMQRKGCTVNEQHKTIEIPVRRALGNKSWGVVSFLCRFHGLAACFVE